MDLAAPRTGFTRDEMIALGMGYRTHDTTGYEVRSRGIPDAASALPLALTGHSFRGTTTGTTEGDQS